MQKYTVVTNLNGTNEQLQIKADRYRWNAGLSSDDSAVGTVRFLRSERTVALLNAQHVVAVLHDPAETDVVS